MMPPSARRVQQGQGGRLRNPLHAHKFGREHDFAVLGQLFLEDSADAPLPPEKRLTTTNVQKLYKGKHSLLESGLLGPVRILRRTGGSSGSR